MKKILFLLVIFTFSEKCFALTTLNQAVVTDISSEVSITTNGGVITGSITPETGIVTALTPSFRIQTNILNSDNYTIAMRSIVTLNTGSTVSAYGGTSASQYIILANTTNKPTATSISNIKSTPTAGGNPNAIAYPAVVTTTPSLTTSAQFISNTYYKIITGIATDITVTQTIGTNPISNTYLIGEDTAGIYQAVITLTAADT